MSYQWSLERLEAPVIDPVSLDEAKAWLRVRHSAEDDLISGIIKAAVSYLDGSTGYLGRCLVTQKWRLYREGLTYNGYCINIRLGNVKSIEQIIMTDDDVDQIVSVADYEIFKRGLYHAVKPVRGKHWPSHDLGEAAIKVDFWAGEPVQLDSNNDPVSVDLPENIKMALKLLIAHYYQNRSAVTSEKQFTLPMGVKTLLSGHRIPVI